MLPSNIPNTSQVLPDHGPLPNVQVHYTIPADEKQIIASLRALQRDLNGAMQTIHQLTRERDEALHELRLLRAASKKASTPAKKQKAAVSRVEEELFDLSRLEDSPTRSPAGRASMKEVQTENRIAATKTNTSDHARVLSLLPTNRPPSPVSEKRTGGRFAPAAPGKGRQYKKPAVNDTEQSIVIEDPTAVSNTSRRRRHLSLDDNMTSAYILPDITVNHQQGTKIHVSKQAQEVLHSHEPRHVEHCEVCQRLTSKKAKSTSLKPDFTAQITELMRDAALEEPTLRPKIPPSQALANIKRMLTEQFEEAKRKHSQAWEKYDAIEAPLNSKRHAAASQDLFYWSKKMEECRVNLDQLRDVEEGMKAAGEL